MLVHCHHEGVEKRAGIRDVFSLFLCRVEKVKKVERSIHFLVKTRGNTGALQVLDEWKKVGKDVGTRAFGSQNAGNTGFFARFAC